MSQQIKLDILPSGEAYTIARCSQGDIGREINISLYDGENAYTIPAGAYVEVAGKKADGFIFAYSDNITISHDRKSVTISTKEQMTACAGPVMCEIRIKTGTALIGTCNFVLMCEGGAIDGVASTSDISLIAQVEADIQNALAAATQAAQSASNAAASATAAAASATAASDSATAAAGSASDASRSATAAALSATAADTAARNAASSETNAATSEQNASNSASAAAQSATTAQGHATEAAAKAGAAAISETNAAASATAAAASATAAQSVLIVTETIVEILATDWDSSTHLVTVTVQGVTTTSTQEIAPLIANDSTNITNNEVLANAQLYDAGQGTNYITLYAVNIPTEKVKVRVLQRGVNANA